MDGLKSSCPQIRGGFKGGGGVQYSLILRGKRAPKKRNFSGQNLQKVSKNAFFGPFFQKFACVAVKLARKGLFSALVELENQISQLKKKGRPLKKILDPRLPQIMICF